MPLIFLLLSFMLGCSTLPDDTTVIAVVPTPTLAPDPTTPFVSFAETAEVSEDLLYVEGLLAEIASSERDAIFGIDPNSGVTVEVLLGAEDIPVATSGPRATPCLVDTWASPNAISQGFYWSAGMGWKTPGYHPGVDIVCGGRGSNEVLVSPVDHLVVSRYFINYQTDQDTITYWSSGETHIGQTLMPTERLNPQIIATLNITEDYVPMVFGIGHMLDEAGWPEAGEIVRIQDYIGHQGSTGLSAGEHAHYAWFIVQDNYTLYAVDATTAFVANR